MTGLDEAVEELRSNPGQWEAFEEARHCAVLAPPGSGKTKLLTTKLAYSLMRGAVRAPRGAACITMTNEAALQLRRRLRRLGVTRRPNLFVGTVHAFALSRVVGPFAASAGRAELAASHLATDAELQEAFHAAFQSMSFRPEERGEIERTTAKARQRLDLSGNPLLGGQPVAETALRLQAELEARHLYDFHDLVRHAVDLVEQHGWVRRVLGATYPLIYVDEYQDLAPGLDRIVRAVTLGSDAESTLFAVGDPDQAIYAFSGAHPALLRELADEPAVTRVSLEHNYRCAEDIIAISLRALGEDRSITGDRSGGTVTLHVVEGGEQAQAAKAHQLVQRALDRGVAHDEIAVIAPWASDRDRCAAELRAAGIPVYARVDDGWRPTSLTVLLETMASWASQQSGAGIGLHELLESFSGIVPSAREHATMRAVVRVLLDAHDEGPAGEFVARIVSAALQAYVDDPTASEDARELARMQQSLGPDGSAHAMTIAELAARARAPGHVMAATIHGAKGLEFDVVLLVGADEGGLPGFSPNQEQLAEGRRKFYVSITRAREEVHLIRTDCRVSRRGATYAVRPSPFIEELGLSGRDV